MFKDANDGATAPFSQLIIVFFPTFILFATSCCVNLAFTLAAAKLICITSLKLIRLLSLNLVSVYHHFKCVSTLSVKYFHFFIAIFSLLVYDHYKDIGGVSKCLNKNLMPFFLNDYAII